jgi:hypothetical protein
MQKVQADQVERVLDEGQWFERGARVEFFESTAHPRQRTLEPAALGSYEVLKCERQSLNGTRWLAITLRPFSFR